MSRASLKAGIPDMTAMTAAACLLWRTLVPCGFGIRPPRLEFPRYRRAAPRDAAGGDGPAG